MSGGQGLSEADRLIALLDLRPHPEGGYFRETFRDGTSAGRPFSTAIYFLLKAGEISRWHRIDASETWHSYRGGTVELTIAPPRAPRSRHILGNDLANGEAPQIVVPARCWQMARPLGDYALMGCTVAPGFDFAGFELAPDGFEPG